MTVIEYEDNSQFEKKRRTITIDKASVFADVDNLTQKYADGRQMDNVKREDAFVSDTTSHYDMAIIERLAEFRASELWMILARVVADDREVTEEDNSLMAGGDYVYVFDMPVAFKDQKLKALAILMHRYILWGILHDWYEYLGDAAQAAAFKKKADDVKDEIKDMVMVPSRVKKPLQPFGPAHKLHI